MKTTIADMMNGLGMGYAYTLGQILDCLAHASSLPASEQAEWLDKALALADRMRTYAHIPSFPMPAPVLQSLADHALPESFATAVRAIWLRPGQPTALRTAIENLRGAG